MIANVTQGSKITASKENEIINAINSGVDIDFEGDDYLGASNIGGRSSIGTSKDQSYNWLTPPNVFDFDIHSPVNPLTDPPKIFTYLGKTLSNVIAINGKHDVTLQDSSGNSLTGYNGWYDTGLEVISSGVGLVLDISGNSGKFMSMEDISADASLSSENNKIYPLLEGFRYAAPKLSNCLNLIKYQNSSLDFDNTKSRKVDSEVLNYNVKSIQVNGISSNIMSLYGFKDLSNVISSGLSSLSSDYMLVRKIETDLSGNKIPTLEYFPLSDLNDLSGDSQIKYPETKSKSVEVDLSARQIRLYDFLSGTPVESLSSDDKILIRRMNDTYGYPELKYAFLSSLSSSTEILSGDSQVDPISSKSIVVDLSSKSISLYDFLSCSPLNNLESSDYMLVRKVDGNGIPTLKYAYLSSLSSSQLCVAGDSVFPGNWKKTDPHLDPASYSISSYDTVNMKTGVPTTVFSLYGIMDPSRWAPEWNVDIREWAYPDVITRSPFSYIEYSDYISGYGVSYFPSRGFVRFADTQDTTTGHTNSLDSYLTSYVNENTTSYWNYFKLHNFENDESLKLLSTDTILVKRDHELKYVNPATLNVSAEYQVISGDSNKASPSTKSIDITGNIAKLYNFDTTSKLTALTSDAILAKRDNELIYIDPSTLSGGGTVTGKWLNLLTDVVYDSTTHQLIKKYRYTKVLDYDQTEFSSVITTATSHAADAAGGNP